MGIILELLEYINVKSKSLLEYIHKNNPISFRIYIHGNNPRSIRDIMVKSKSRSIYTMAKKGRNILEKIKKIPKKTNLDRNSSRRHCGARSEQWCVCGIYRLRFVGIG
jgi:predicted transcriptional regulator